MVRPVQKPADVLNLGRVDCASLQNRVGGIGAQAWQREDARKENAFPCFHDTKHVIFRFIEGNQDPSRSYDTQAWPLWEPLLLPVMRQAIASFGFKSPSFPKAMLARLAAGSFIDVHRDGAGSNLLTHKIHVPLFTNPHARFIAGGAEHELQVGWAYEVNNIALHGAVNRGETDRIHFIFEVFEGGGEFPDPEPTGPIA
jgi:hypothetical protein